jgi:hypothetical protein
MVHPIRLGYALSGLRIIRDKRITVQTDDVFLRAWLQYADRDHGGFGCPHLPGDNGLKAQHWCGGHHHGIDARLGHGAVSASSKHSDLHAVAGGSDDSGARASTPADPTMTRRPSRTSGLGKR